MSFGGGRGVCPSPRAHCPAPGPCARIPLLQYHGCAALKNLAWKSDRMTEEIVAKGGIEVVATVARNHAQNQSLRALAGQVQTFLIQRHGGGQANAQQMRSPTKAARPTLSEVCGAVPGASSGPLRRGAAVLVLLLPSSPPKGAAWVDPRDARRGAGGD